MTVLPHTHTHTCSQPLANPTFKLPDSIVFAIFCVCVSAFASFFAFLIESIAKNSVIIHFIICSFHRLPDYMALAIFVLAKYILFLRAARSVVVIIAVVVVVATAHDDDDGPIALR